MYAEITALSNSKGFCNANNQYFANLYDVSNRSVSRWITHLSELGYIKVFFLKKGAVVTERRIKITGENPLSRRTEKSLVTEDKKFQENTTSNIELDQLEAYCKENNLNVDCVIYLTHYQSQNWCTKNGNKIKNWKNSLRQWDKNRRARIKSNVTKISKIKESKYWEGKEASQGGSNV